LLLRQLNITLKKKLELLDSEILLAASEVNFMTNTELVFEASSENWVQTLETNSADSHKENSTNTLTNFQDL